MSLATPSISSARRCRADAASITGQQLVVSGVGSL